MTIFFYDSYAVIEYLNDNQRFKPYFEEHTGILTILNLLEVYYSVLQEAGREKADTVFDTLFPLVVEPTKETVKRSMQFRLLHKKDDLSYADCLGYGVALERGIKFLTGDSKFKDVTQVEFLK